jgi:hypothetical protein
MRESGVTRPKRTPKKGVKKLISEHEMTKVTGLSSKCCLRRSAHEQCPSVIPIWMLKETVLVKDINGNSK